MNMTIEQRGDAITSITLNGRFDLQGVKEIDQKLADAITTGAMDAVIDLSRVSFIASSGIHTLVTAAKEVVQSIETPAIHVYFASRDEVEILARHGFIARISPRYLWVNHGYASFDEFLARLKPKRRQVIRRERRKVVEAGVTIREVRGAGIDATVTRSATTIFRMGPPEGQDSDFDRSGRHPFPRTWCREDGGQEREPERRTRIERELQLTLRRKLRKIGERHIGRPEKLRRDLEGSLKRLRLERIDLYQFHAPDPRVPYSESIGTLADLQRAGKIRHLGVSNVTVAQLEEARRIRDLALVSGRALRVVQHAFGVVPK